MVDIATLDDWYGKIRTQWEWIAGCAEFAVLWDSEDFQIWFEDQPIRAREALLMISKSVVGNNAAAGIARIFDPDKGNNRICIPRLLNCLENLEVAEAYCRAHDGDDHLRFAQEIWKILQDTPSHFSAQTRQPKPTLMLDAFRKFRNARQAHLLETEPESVFYADMWHLAREAGVIIESLGRASGTCTVSASSVKGVWAERHMALFSVWKS
jgi:hypothetical protein